MLYSRYRRLEGDSLPTAESGTPTPPPAPKKKHTAAMVGGGVLMIVFLVFVWRVVFFYVGIVRGTAAPPTSFIQSLTVDSSIAVPLGNSDIDIDVLATADDPTFGASPDRAILTIVEFADFGCPFSREASYVVRALAEHTDVVRYVYRDFPIIDLHPGADLAAEAGECAQEQGRFLDYHDKLYQNQFDLSGASLKRYAEEIGFNTTAFNNCLDSRRYKDEVEEDRQAGIAVGVRGTPTFFFNGIKVEGAIPRDVFTSLLNRFRAAAELVQ